MGVDSAGFGRVFELSECAFQGALFCFGVGFGRLDMI
jgi:hypothetical protein